VSKNYEEILLIEYFNIIFFGTSINRFIIKSLALKCLRAGKNIDFNLNDTSKAT